MRFFGFFWGGGLLLTDVVFYLGTGVVAYSLTGFWLVGVVCLIGWLISKDKTEEVEMGNQCALCNCSLPPVYPSAYCPSCEIRMRNGPALNSPNSLRSQVSYGFVSGGSISSLGQAAPAPSRPAPTPEERAEPVYGWRAYTLTPDGVLQGMRVSWTERHFDATCKKGGEVQEQVLVRSMLGDDVAYRFWLERKGLADAGTKRCESHLESGTCSCGVYLRGKPEWFDEGMFVMAKALAYGVVAVDEDGNARASQVQIEALYVVKNASRRGVPDHLRYTLISSGFSPDSISDLLEKPDPLRAFIDWDRIANVLRGRYDVPVQVVDTLEAITESPLANP